MAQYFQLSNDKSQTNQLYNSEDAQAVQYIIAEEATSQFPQQQVLISSEPLMVVEGQQVVIDQSQVSFQQNQVRTQYIQNNGVTVSATSQQQVFYMEGHAPRQVAEQAPQLGQTPTGQPIVLNHQLGASNTIIRTKVNTTQLQQQMRQQLRPPGGQHVKTPALRNLPAQPRSVLTPPQIRANAPQIPTQVRVNVPGLLNKQQQVRMIRQQGPVTQQQQSPANIAMFKQQATLQQGQQPPKPISKMLQEFQQQQSSDNVAPKQEEETVLLSDGSSVPVSVYTKMRTQAIRNRHGNQPTLATTNQSPVQIASPPVSQPVPPKLGNETMPTTTPPNQSPVQGGASPGNQQVPSKLAPRQGLALARNRHMLPRVVRPGMVRPSGPRPGVRPPPPNYSGPPQRMGQPRFPMQTQQEQGPQTKPQFQQQHQQNQVVPHLPQQQQQQRTPQHNQQQLQSPPQASYLITPPQPNRPQRPLPSYIASSQIQQIIENTPIAEEFADSIRMLVLLENGEQRLITFTLPKEACTIHEILEQVNVPFTADTNIQVTEANTGGINYIVMVGNVNSLVKEEDATETDESVCQNTPLNQSTETSSVPATPEPPQASSPEPMKEAPRLVPGKLAVCNNCGILSEDFNRCMRCKKKFPDNVKAVPAPHSNGDVKITLTGATANIVSGNKPTLPSAVIRVQANAVSAAKNSPGIVKKKPGKANKIAEHESVVISSDEEEDEKSCKKIVGEQLLKSLGASITICPITKEPSLMEMKKFTRRANKEEDNAKQYHLSIKCRTVRIGSYRYSPPEDVEIDSTGITILAPMLEDKNELKTIKIDQKDIIKVLVSFGKALPVVFYYLNPSIAPNIRTVLGMSSDSDIYFDPISEKEDSFRRITLLPEEFNDELKVPFQQIYNIGPICIMEELSTREANEILIKICPKDASKPLGSAGFTEIKQILVYPPEGRGRIAINTEDYICLAQDQFLNDVIIDFYLKYLVDNLPVEMKEKVHVFSTFFYKRLTTKPTKASRKSQPTEWDPNLNAAQKRHARVKTWTKSVNLFQKDFVVVPINENAHWFLAIICYPGMDGPHTFDGLPYKLETNPRKSRTVKKEKPIVCEEPEGSDRDEAEGDESDLESDDSEEVPTPQNSQPAAPATPPPTVSPKSKEPRPRIKQPCILIFDSLTGTGRNRVVATLRDYLTCEYQAKTNEEKVYNKDVIKGASPKVPQQTNFTDCGLYVLQYVEQFFTAPIDDYRIPISSIKNWFDEIIVTKKREDIANLIKDLMKKNGKDVNTLPEISFPTLNGKIVEALDKSDVTEEEESDMFTDIEDSQLMEQEEQEDGLDSIADEEKTEDEMQSPMKPSIDNATDFMTQTVNTSLLKPTTTNRDTLSYLKAKRIIRHKNVDGPEVKKIKTDGSDSN